MCHDVRHLHPLERRLGVEPDDGRDLVRHVGLLLLPLVHGHPVHDGKHVRVGVDDGVLERDGERVGRRQVGRVHVLRAAAHLHVDRVVQQQVAVVVHLDLLVEVRRRPVLPQVLLVHLLAVEPRSAALAEARRVGLDGVHLVLLAVVHLALEGVGLEQEGHLLLAVEVGELVVVLLAPARQASRDVERGHGDVLGDAAHDLACRVHGRVVARGLVLDEVRIRHVADGDAHRRLAVVLAHAVERAAAVSLHAGVHRGAHAAIRAASKRRHEQQPLLLLAVPALVHLGPQVHVVHPRREPLLVCRASRGRLLGLRALHEDLLDLLVRLEVEQVDLVVLVAQEELHGLVGVRGAHPSVAHLGRHGVDGDVVLLHEGARRPRVVLLGGERQEHGVSGGFGHHLFGG